jgi:TRAP-type mannitol/chloroaromatic compound transport system permease small subunit
MLTAIGDVLNWTAAGVVFPLMFLPLAAFAAGRRRLAGSLIFALMVSLAAGAAATFIAAAPRLDLAGMDRKAAVFAGALAGLTALVALLGGPLRATEKLAPMFAAIARGAGRLVMWLTLAMALAQFGVVILRYVFGINSIFMQESITYMHGAVFLLAAGYALLTDDHVRVDIFYRGASPKRKAMADFLGTYLFLFPVLLVVLWTASDYVGHSWSVREGSNEQSGIQGVFLLKSLIPAFAVLLAMAGFVHAARAGKVLRGER